jgi:hypothetical protein
MNVETVLDYGRQGKQTDANESSGHKKRQRLKNTLDFP